MDSEFLPLARRVIDRCRELALCTEEPGFTTRTFLSAPMHRVHALLRGWMEQAGLSVHVDDAGNLRGRYAAATANAPHLFIGSHLDTVPQAGAFDGILGVILAVALVEQLAARPLKVALEIVGFSEEEGVRFGVPFIGSRALAGTVDDSLALKDAEGISLEAAIRNFGLDSSRIGDAVAGPDALAIWNFTSSRDLSSKASTYHWALSMRSSARACCMLFLRAKPIMREPPRCICVATRWRPPLNGSALWNARLER